jgi:hypothetical protein
MQVAAEKRGRTESRGPQKAKSVRKPVPAIGERFGRLVVDAVKKRSDGRTWSRASCDCGTEEVFAKPSHLRRGETVSCGCVRRERALVMVGQQGQGATASEK